MRERLGYAKLFPRIRALHATPVQYCPSVATSARSRPLGSVGSMMQSIIPWIGIFAAALTSLSYVPQVQKAWPRGSTSDLSLKMLLALTAGLALWIVYGFIKGDWVIVAANGIGAALSASVLTFKIRDLRSERGS
jgi:MtN3 and saliva related transmembrane protein